MSLSKNTLIISACVVLILSVFSYGQVPPNYYAEEQAASRILERKKLKTTLKRLKRKVKTEPQKADQYRQKIVAILVQLDASPGKILKVVGKGFEKPDRDILLNIAGHLAYKGEKLDRAEEFLELAAKLPRPVSDFIGTGGFRDCRPEKIRFLLDFHWEKYQKIIVHDQNMNPKASGQSGVVIQAGGCTKSVADLDQSYSYYIGYSYYRLGRIDDALEAFLNLPRRKIDKNGSFRKDFERIYRTQHGSLDGLQDTIDARDRKRKLRLFVNRYLTKIPYPGFSLKNSEGMIIKHTDFPGKIFAIRTFYADRYLLPYFRGLEAIQQKYQNDVVVIAVEKSSNKSVRERRRTINHYLSGFRPTFPVLFTSNQKQTEQIDPGKRRLFILDPEGYIRFKKSGGYETLDTQLDYLIKLLKQPK